MKETGYFEMFVPIYQTTRRNTPEDGNFKFNRRPRSHTRNSKSVTVKNMAVKPTCQVLCLTRTEDNE
jgi:hypothetical protein